MEEEEGGRVLLALPGVSVPLSLPPRLLPGRLRLLQTPQDLVLQWEPLEAPWDPPGDAEPPDPGFEPDWAVLSPPRPRPEPGWAGGFRLGLAELRGLRRGPPGLRPPFLVLLPRGGPCPPPLHLPRGGLRKLLRALGGRLRPCPRDPRLLLLATPEDPPEPPPEPGLVSRLLQGPYAATLGGLSRLLGGPRGDPEPEPEPPFEELSCISLGPRPSPPRGPPLDAAEWGRGLEPEALRERIFRGGLSPEVRARGWRLLLGLRERGDPESAGGTPKGAGGTPGGPGEGPDPARARRDDYFRMKLQWRSLSPGQLRRNKTLRGYQEQLERDLARAPPWAPPSLLRDLLMTFCMWHFDLGYVRGMAELLPPLLSVTPDEAEAFWAFCGLMEMAGSSFGPGLRRRRAELGALGRALSPALGRRMELRWPRSCCSRWLQFRFQRHLGMEGTRRVWEVLWTGLPCPNFHLLVTCALLELLGDSDDGDSDSDGDTAPGDSDSEDSDGDRVSLAVPLDVAQVLSRAEGIFLQLAASAELPPALQELLGLGGRPPGPPPGPPPEPPPETSP